MARHVRGMRERASPSLFLRGRAWCGGFATHAPGCSAAGQEAQPGVIFTVHAPDTVRPSTSTRTPSPGTVKLSPGPTGASASGG